MHWTESRGSFNVYTSREAALLYFFQTLEQTSNQGVSYRWSNFFFSYLTALYGNNLIIDRWILKNGKTFFCGLCVEVLKFDSLLNIHEFPSFFFQISAGRLNRIWVARGRMKYLITSRWVLVKCIEKLYFFHFPE